MPQFQVVGIGKITGRKRKRIYEAEDIDSAIMMAADDGTIVEVGKTEILPEPPATERQIEYAKDLGIKIPKNTDIKELSFMISAAVDYSGPYHGRIRKILLDAMKAGEVVNIAYRGGKQPRTQRQLFPVKIYEQSIEAICLASGERKTYYISRMQLITDDIHFEPYRKKGTLWTWLLRIIGINSHAEIKIIRGLK